MSTLRDRSTTESHKTPRNGRLSGPPDWLKNTAMKPPNGECPFSEDDAAEIYADRYDFFRHELNLQEAEAVRRARESTENWRKHNLTA